MNSIPPHEFASRPTSETFVGRRRATSKARVNELRSLSEESDRIKQIEAGRIQKRQTIQGIVSKEL